MADRLSEELLLSQKFPISSVGVETRIEELRRRAIKYFSGHMTDEVLMRLDCVNEKATEIHK
jgi:hypothetical protein